MNNEIKEPSQLYLFDEQKTRHITPFNTSLLKWIGSKQRFAHEIIAYFPIHFGRYFEPFLGSGAILGTFEPKIAIGSDSFYPLIEIWKTLKESPETLKKWYQDRWERMETTGKIETYEAIKASFNANPNGADLLFLTRSCYGGWYGFEKPMVICPLLVGFINRFLHKVSLKE